LWFALTEAIGFVIINQPFGNPPLVGSYMWAPWSQDCVVSAQAASCAAPLYASGPGWTGLVDGEDGMFTVD